MEYRRNADEPSPDYADARTRSSCLSQFAIWFQLAVFWYTFVRFAQSSERRPSSVTRADSSSQPAGAIPAWSTDLRSAAASSIILSNSAHPAVDRSHYSDLVRS